MSLWNQIVSKIKLLVTQKSLSGGGALALALAVYYLFKSKQAESMAEVKLSYFLLALKQNLISEILFDGIQLFFRGYNNETWFLTNASILKKDRIYKLLKDKPEVQFKCINKLQPFGLNQAFLILGISACTGFLLQRLMAQFRVPSTQVQENGVKFASIYGLEHAKKSLNQIINFLTEPQKYRQVGARLRRGVMIYGPPGTGKTMLAKAVANESKVKFFYRSATEFQEVYVGLGAKRVRELFEMVKNKQINSLQARQQAPAIIFIDEIDSIAYKRVSKNSGLESGGDNERVNTLNQLLTEIDGFNQTDNIVLIAATNRITVLDDAFMRSGRFDIKIQIKLPSFQERFGILKLHLEKKKHTCSDQILQDIAQKSEGFSGADMENIANESAYISIEDLRQTINDEDIQASFNKLLEEKKSIINQRIQLLQD